MLNHSHFRLVCSCACATLLALTLVGCRQERLFQQSFLAFGTLVELSIYGAAPELEQRAADTVRRDFEFLHATWHPWESGSLKRINTLIPSGASFSVGPGFPEVIARARELSRQSGGRFNPAIGNLVQLWGFDREDQAQRMPPAADRIAALVAKAPSLDDLVIEGVRLKSRNPYVYLDFGAYIPGHATELIGDRLKAMGIKHAILNAGGEVRAFGRRGTRPWRIGIRAPRNPGVIAYVDIDGDETVVTSGDYERYFEHEGRRYCHILDPRNGYPAQGVQAVTVIHEKGAVADAASISLFVAGPEEWTSVAAAMNITQAMLIDAQGRVHLTPAMQRRLEFVAEPKPEMLVEPIRPAENAVP